MAEMAELDTETMGSLILKTNKSNQHYFCESRKCKYHKIDTVYSWIHAKDLGWTFERADLDLRGGYKLSGINRKLTDDAGNLITIYCPECSKEK